MRHPLDNGWKAYATAAEAARDASRLSWVYGGSWAVMQDLFAGALFVVLPATTAETYLGGDRYDLNAIYTCHVDEEEVEYRD